jgi:hypothetical protein
MYFIYTVIEDSIATRNFICSILIVVHGILTVFDIEEPAVKPDLNGSNENSSALKVNISYDLHP